MTPQKHLKSKHVYEQNKRRAQQRKEQGIEMIQKNEAVTAKLKEIIDRNGPHYLTEEPYKVYLALLQSEVTDKKTASMILYLLVNEVQQAIRSESDLTSIAELIQNQCSLNSEAAEALAEIFFSLYSKENEEAWKKKDREGLKQFLAEKFSMSWNGFAIWEESNGSVNCFYQAEITLSPTKNSAADPGLVERLQKNPFMTKEAIHVYFEEKINDFLNDEFENYCTNDDYYQPCVDDFYIDDCVSEWAKKHGFTVLSCEGEGSDGGYDPAF